MICATQVIYHYVPMFWWMNLSICIPEHTERLLIETFAETFEHEQQIAPPRSPHSMSRLVVGVLCEHRQLG